MLLAGVLPLHYAGTVRSVLGATGAAAGSSVQLVRVAFAGALVGMAGIATAIVTIAGSTSEGADVDPAAESDASLS